MATQLSLSGIPVTPSRKSYTREFKLKVVQFYRDPKNTIYATSKLFNVSNKCILRWARDESSIIKSSKGSKHLPHPKVGTHHRMEELLHQEFQELRSKGLKVKAFWFKTRAKQLLDELEPGTTFAFSSGWFDRFKARFSISLRRPTNIAQKPASDKEEAIRQFHHGIRKLAKPRPGAESSDVGCYKLSQVANMDQTPLPFCFSDGPTYSDTGASTVWVRGGASGMEKRQCTVQLTIFADGVPRVKPLIIFRGKGLRITLREKVLYDQNVRVTFQPKAWCDERVMREWLNLQWKPACEGDTLLVLDVHKAQKTDDILHTFSTLNTSPVYVPAGTTGLVQPLDVVFNGPFKAAVKRLADDHVRENLDDYVQGTIPASRRRILFTQWVGKAWKQVSNNKEMVVRSFRKCGISVPIDGSMDKDINIKDLPEYSVGDIESDDESTDDESTTDDEDPFGTA